MSRYKDLMELADTFEKAAQEAEDNAKEFRRAQQEYLRQALELKSRK